ncbi:hypothetical protein LG198_13675 [Methylobacillus arboreus]|uniref:hypothetical protein n=1 Tax=Methylobacillus arboreus TaxID=755170 RepID=UPI001E406950|nr:hypothetical protein [Methylobacillus arboreus]MCB5191784.1 hypothetical protein [Methylobacillus arboreus]
MFISVLQASLASAGEKSCSTEVGKRHAEMLVNWCKNVSPATHPPCNAANSCDLVIDEIKRGCAFLKHEKNSPYYCRLTYRGSDE